MRLLGKLLGRRSDSVTPWVTYRSQVGFFSIEHPVDWSVSVEDNIVNVSPPDGTGAVTVSAFHGTTPVPNFAEKWLEDTFEQEEPLSEREAVARNGWSGFRQGFVSSGPDPRAWVAIVAALEPVFVLITANDIPKQFGERGETYGRILESLCLHRPGEGRPGA